MLSSLATALTPWLGEVPPDHCVLFLLLGAAAILNFVGLLVLLR